jgi:hypothetical protein
MHGGRSRHFASHFLVSPCQLRVMSLLGLDPFFSPTSHSQVRILRHSFETVCVCCLLYRDRPVMFHAYAQFVLMGIALCDPQLRVLVLDVFAPFA